MLLGPWGLAPTFSTRPAARNAVCSPTLLRQDGRCCAVAQSIVEEKATKLSEPAHLVIPVTGSDKLQNHTISTSASKAEHASDGNSTSTPGLSPQLAAWAKCNQPLLLDIQAHQLQARVNMLSKVLECSEQQALAVVVKQPAFLKKPEAALHTGIQRLKKALGLSGNSQAARIVRRIPAILDSADDVAVRLKESAPLLHISFAEAVKVVERQPGLLVLAPTKLQSKLTGLAEALQLKGGDKAAAEFVCAHPDLLQISPSHFGERISSLSGALQITMAGARTLLMACPEALTYSSQRMSKYIAAMTPLFPKGQLQGMVFEEPYLLTRTTSAVQRNVRTVMQLAAISRPAALGLIARRPQLLTCSPASLMQSFRALSVWRFSGEEKLELLREHPLLLKLSSAEVHGRCRWLRDLMMSNGFYHSTMRELPMTLLGAVLLHLPSAWSRLQFLADTSQETKMHVMEAAQCSKAEFEKAFPEHNKWLHWRVQEMGAPVPWRAPNKPKSSAVQGNKERAASGASASTSKPNADGELSTSGNKPQSQHQQHHQRQQQQQQRRIERSTSERRSTRVKMVDEATVKYVGLHPVHKPRRVVMCDEDEEEPLTQDPSSDASTSDSEGESQAVRPAAALQHSHAASGDASGGTGAAGHEVASPSHSPVYGTLSHTVPLQTVGAVVEAVSSAATAGSA